MLSSIVYKTTHHNRRMVVVDGQPYYQSTGENSDLPGMWLPFILIQYSNQSYHQYGLGLISESTKFYTAFDKQIRRIREAAPISSGYIFKLTTEEVEVDYTIPSKEKKVYRDYFATVMGEPTVVKTDCFQGRIPQKKHFITSLRLQPTMRYSDECLKEDFKLNDQEIALTKQKLIIEESELTLSVPDFINQWLAEQGGRLPIENLEVKLDRFVCLREKLESEEILFSKINDLKNKAKYFKNNGHTNAYTAAKDVENSIRLAYYKYRRNTDFSEKYPSKSKVNQNEMALNQFKLDCNQFIRDAHVELDKFRGWKKVLNNLALAVLGLGLFYFAGCVYNQLKNNEFFFSSSYSFLKSDSGNLLDKTQSHLDKLCLQRP